MKTGRVVRAALVLAMLAAVFTLCTICARLAPTPTPTPTPRATPTKIPPTPTSTPLPSVNLVEAIERGDVQVEICGAWRIAGTSMVMTITRLVPGPLEVTVQPGTVLYTSQEGYQNMLVTEEKRITLLDDTPQKVDLVAYCIDAFKHEPTDEVSYSVGMLEDSELKQLVTALPDIEDEKYFGQAPLLGAIWSLTDDITITKIQRRLMYGYASEDIVKAKLILEKAGIDTSSRLLFSPQDETEMATWHEGRGDYLYWVEERMDEAIAEYTKAIECEPRAHIYQMRAFAYEHKEDYDKALADYDKAIELEPSFVFYKSKAELHVKMGEYEEAIANYEKAIELAPDEDHASSLHEDRAEMCMEQGYYDQAIADYTKCIELEPEQAWRYHDRGRAYMEKSNYKAAVADYTKAIELKPEWDLSYYCRGEAYKELGENDKAIADFEKVIAMGGSWTSSAERQLKELKREK